MATNLGNYSVGYEVDEKSLKQAYNQILSEVEKTGKVSQDTLNKMISTGSKEGFDNAIKAAKDAVVKIQKQILDAQDQMKELKRRGDDENIEKGLAYINDLNQKLKDAKGTVKDLEKQSTSSGSKIQNIFKAIASSAIFMKLKGLVSDMIDIGDSAQKAHDAFTTILGDVNSADRMLSDLNQFAKSNFLDVETVRENAKQLLAMGISADNLVPTMQSLGDVSTALNVPLERLATNYGQVRTQGKLTGTDLKDFLKAGVPLTDELAKNLGKSTEEIKKMVSEGKIKFKDVEKAFQTMTSEGGKFYGMMAANGNTWQGQMQAVKTNLKIIAEQIMTSLLPIITKLGSAIRSVAEKISDFVAKHKTLSAAIAGITVVGGGLITAFTAISALLPTLSAGLAALGISFGAIAWPIAAITAAIIGLSAAYDAYNNYQEESRLKNIASEGSLKDLIEKVEENKKKQEELNDAYADGKISASEYNDQLEKLIKENDDFTGALKYSIDSQQDLNDAIDYFNSVEVNTSKERDELVKLAKSVNTAAQEYVQLAKSRLLALSATNIYAKQEVEHMETQEGKRSLVGAGSMATMTDSLALQQLQLDIANKDMSKLEEVQAAREDYKKGLEAQKKLEDQIKAFELKTFGGSDDGGGGGGGGGSGTKKIKASEQAVKDLEKAYKDMDSSLDKANKAAEKYNDAQQKFWKETNDDIKKIDDSLAKLKDNYEKTIQSINDALNEKNSNDVESYVKDQYTKMRDLQKEISNMERGRDEDGNSVDYDGSKISKYRSQIDEIKRNLDEVGEISGLGDSGIDAIISKVKERYDLETEEAKKLYDLKEQLRKNEEEALAKKEEELKKYEEEKKALERKKLITQAMQQANIKNEAELDEFKKKIAYDQFSLEEQQIIDKYAQEKIELFNKKMDAIAAAEEYYQTEAALMQQNHVVAMSNVKSLSAEYTKLLSQLSTAISRERTLIALRSSGGYAEGGYTGAGDPHDVAGVVHRGEWVMPNWMVKSMRGTVAGLEAIRTGNSSVINNSTTKHQTNNITVNSRFDIEGFLGKANWKF